MVVRNISVLISFHSDFHQSRIGTRGATNAKMKNALFILFLLVMLLLKTQDHARKKDPRNFMFSATGENWFFKGNSSVICRLVKTQEFLLLPPSDTVIKGSFKS